MGLFYSNTTRYHVFGDLEAAVILVRGSFGGHHGKGPTLIGFPVRSVLFRVPKGL